MLIKLGTRKNYQDQGTDIYINKIDEGAGYGSGYIVQVYDYGQKVSEDKVKTKKDVKRIIDEQKHKYQTDRAFEEESHLFVSYKIDDIESKKFRDKNNITIKESSMDTDTLLYKQASRISNLLSLSKDPRVPIKFFKTADVADPVQDINSSNPLNTANSAENSNSDNLPSSPITSVDVEGFAVALKEKLLKYLNEHTDEHKDNPTNLARAIDAYFTDDIIPILDKEGFSVDDKSKLKEILKLAFREMGDSRLQEVFFKVAGVIKKERVGTSIINSPISSNIMQNSSPANSTTQGITTPESLSPQAQDVVNKINQLTPKQTTLTPEAQKLEQQIINKDTGNGIDPGEFYNIVNNTPNGKSVLDEIAKKQTPTNAQSTALNYHALYAEGLYRFAGQEIASFYAEVKNSAKHASFDKTFTRWASNKSYSPLEEFVVNYRKASFMETANYQLNNKGGLPKDFYAKQAGEQFAFYYIVRYGAESDADWGQHGVQASSYFVKAVSFLMRVSPTHQLTAEEGKALAQEVLSNPEIASNPNFNSDTIAADITRKYVEYAFPLMYKKKLYSSNIDNKSIDQFTASWWKSTFADTAIHNDIVTAVVTAIPIGLNFFKTNADRVTPFGAEYTQAMVDTLQPMYVKSANSQIIVKSAIASVYNNGNNGYIEEYGQKTKAYKSYNPSHRESSLKQAVTINITEAPNGDSAVSVEDDKGVATTFNEPATTEGNEYDSSLFNDVSPADDLLDDDLFGEDSESSGDVSTAVSNDPDTAEASLFDSLTD